MKEKYIIELGSITGKRIWFWIHDWKLETWKNILTDQEKEYWEFEQFHDTKPKNIIEWDCKQSLMKLL